MKEHRMYGIWRCEDAHPEMRPNGRPSKPACGRWVHTWTRKRSGCKTDRWLGKCKHCGKKRSLDGAVIKWIYEKDEADDEVRRLNGGEEE